MTRLAIAFLVILCLRAAAQNAPPCTIGGAVVDSVSNKPIAKARVIAEGATYGLIRLTDEQGTFCFAALTPGEYHLRAQKPGYLELIHPVTLTVEPDSPLKPLSMRMARYGSLAGTVLDSDGQFMPGVTVNVWQRTKSGPDSVGDTSTDAQGRFEISQLPSGTYYLSAHVDDQSARQYSIPIVDSHGQIPHEKEVETFYSSSFTFAGATPVELKPGQQLNNLVLGLKKARLRRITGSIGDLSHGSFLTYQRETETGSSGTGAIPVASDGTFVTAGLPPAKYSLGLGDGRKTVARKDVDLTLGDALGITLDPIETVDIPAVVHTEGKGAVFQPRNGSGSGTIFLFPDGSDDGTALSADSDGTYRFPSIVRGIYQLKLFSQQLFLKTVTYGGETQTGGKIDLRSDRPGGLEITLSSNVAEVHGKVALSADETDDLTVILVDGADVVHQAHTDQKGRFRIPSVAPGKYRLFAIEDFDDDDWGNPELEKTLESKSVAVELKENEKKQVSVPAISADEWAAALKKLGG